MSKCRESFKTKSSCSNTKWSTKYQTPAKKSLKDSGHKKVSIWCHLLASYDEYTALVKFGHVASEHVK